MRLLSGLKVTYKVVRSILFAVILIAAVLYIGLYVSLSIPGVQKVIKEKGENAASEFLKSKVEIGRLMIFPFSEVRMQDVRIYTPAGEKCISVKTLGAGINLWRLVYNGKVEITYAELIELDAKISKASEISPLNIDFIIEALSPKDKNKPPTPFDIRLNSVMIRNSALSYDLLYIPVKTDTRKFDANHIALKNLRADVALPRIKNDDFTIDLRRLSFKEKSGFTVDKITAFAHITATSMDISKFSVKLPSGRIAVSDISLQYPSFKNIGDALKSGSYDINISATEISPSDFSAFYNPLEDLSGIFSLKLETKGNLSHLNIDKFNLTDSRNSFNLILKGNLSGLPDINELTGNIDELKLNASGGITAWGSGLLNINEKSPVSKLKNITDIEISGKGNLSIRDGISDVNADIITNLGNIYSKARFKWNKSSYFHIDGDIDVENIDAGKFLDNADLGEVSLTASVDMGIRNKDIEGTADVNIDQLYYKGVVLDDIALKAEKEGKTVEISANVNDEILTADINGSTRIDGYNSQWVINGEVENFIPSALGIFPKYKDYKLRGNISAALNGNTPENLTGTILLSKFSFGKLGNKSLTINSVELTSEHIDGARNYRLSSDVINGSLTGSFTFKGLQTLGQELLTEVSPAFISDKIIFNKHDKKSLISDNEHAALQMVIAPSDEIADFFNVKIRPYDDIMISGASDTEGGFINLGVKAPYLLKGKDKLIRNSDLSVSLKRGEGMNLRGQITMPTKHDLADLSVQVKGYNDNLQTDLRWIFEKNTTAKGNITLEGNVSKDLLTGTPAVAVNLLPSEFELNGSRWHIDRSKLNYVNKTLEVEDLRIWHAGQFVNINGTASSSPVDALKVRLAGIDLSYIFDALDIKNVTFGGYATGEILASNLFSKMPVLKTERLFVKDFSYNSAVLGDARLESHWLNEQKKIAINADIRENNHRVVLAGGGVYLGRDSISFDFLADKVKVEFLQPFLSNITSEIGGKVSGRVKLFGTFKTIDLAGEVMADSIGMKVDYTNVIYHGSDSIHIKPGIIEMPNFMLQDKYGNTAVLNGLVKHNCFYDASFEFRLSDAKNLLAFDTNPMINPDWYGKIFVRGGGVLKGRPGYVSILMDVTTEPGSDFNFILSETQTASDYAFLTFSDKKKEEMEAFKGEVSLEEKLYKSLPKTVEDEHSVFAMDIRCTATPGAIMTLVMDPKAGDKITARGEGPLQISYNTESDEMKIYGKYTLVEGNYNFSLQDLILKDFKIYPGSSISFNGDPLQGVLDITAAYRVNTNLSDLDKSFSTDRDLNRTNVPVDALLKVTGDMRAPEIGFDIALPTLTQDVERKVKSIISTEDMMSRQIIYLLALNRFYTPEYMGSTSNGGELASVASSTLSSQLSSFMGQLTDKVTLAPSFRSDKGDFSDMEVDLALSSRLLNNRLLINGNFGYRDKSTSQSTFIGDFDIEYLLSRNGGLRLKAYNHFNDQNYYLRSALTTQGIGVIYRKDFDNPFTFLKRRKSKKENKKDGTAE